MATRLSLSERLARKRERQVERMTHTVLHLMRNENFDNNLSVNYEVADKAWTPIIQAKIRECISSGIPHLLIPHKVLKAL